MNGPWGDRYEGVKRTWLDENVSLSKLATFFFVMIVTRVAINYVRSNGCLSLPSAVHFRHSIHRGLKPASKKENSNV